MSDLNATINLTEAQIKDAVMQYVRAKGYYPVEVEILHCSGGGDMREYQLPYTTATVAVTLGER